MKYWLLVIGLLISFSAQSSDFQVVEVRVINHKQLSFSISWKHCWNLEGKASPNNHDAVYFFLKGSHNNVQSKTLGLKSISSNSNGVIVKLKSIGGLIETQTQIDTAIKVSLLVDLEEPLLAGDWNINAYALEMAQIPEGSFWVGDSLSNNTLGNQKSSPLLIDCISKSVFQKGDTIALTNNAVSGFKAFYLMKQEICQSNYVDFLNSISEEEAELMKPSILSLPVNSPQRNRCFITQIGKQFGVDANQNSILNEGNDGGAIACNWLTNNQLLAYLSWAGLRPLTELEFEKSCRGPIISKPKEFAWGTIYSTDANELVMANTNFETASETGNDSSGLTNHALIAGSRYIEGPIRSGFAFTQKSNRIRAGAGFYGNADLSGNLWEQCLKVQHDTLLPLGNGTVTYPIEWGSAANYIPRGGAWLSLVFNILGYGFRDLATSDRFYIDYDLDEPRGTVGGRGAL
jgi:formylglycine-generating enzyme required for sulfatase activity